MVEYSYFFSWKWIGGEAKRVHTYSNRVKQTGGGHWSNLVYIAAAKRLFITQAERSQTNDNQETRCETKTVVATMNILKLTELKINQPVRKQFTLEIHYTDLLNTCSVTLHLMSDIKSGGVIVFELFRNHWTKLPQNSFLLTVI